MSPLPSETPNQPCAVAFMGGGSEPANGIATTCTVSPRLASKPIAVFTRSVMRASSAGVCARAASTITARLMRVIFGCWWIRVRTVLLIW